MRYEIKKLADAIGETRHLQDAVHAEVSDPGVPERPDLNLYRIISDITPSFALVAYDGDSPVGCVSCMVTVCPHSSDLVATNDIIYCLPKYRRLGVGGQLFARAQREARSRGAKRFLWQANAGSDLDKCLSKRWRALQTLYRVDL